MRRFLLNIFVLLLVAGSAMGQVRSLTGTVTDAADKSGLPGVSVRVKGALTGTQTGASGQYSIQVPANAVLVFTYIGYTTKEVPVGTSTTVNVELATSAKELSEILVTGVSGITQSARSTSYNAQVVDAEQLNTIRGTSLNNALAGKVAGIQVRSQSVAALGRDTEVRLRGATGFGTGSGALYIVDGTVLPSADDLNIDDIDNVSVLQGPAAAAQFGAQAANGAIVITTKKGKKAVGSGITVNIGAQMDNVSVLPNYQNSYSGGGAADLMKYTWKAGDPLGWKALDGKYYPDYNDDASWGPRMVGQEYIPWYAWYEGTKYSFKTATLDPQPNNSKNFFNTGINLNNSISFSTATDNVSFKLSYGNIDVKGLLPNSSLTKNTLNMVTAYNINNHLTVSANINYINRTLNGEINDDYSNQSTGSLNQWYHRNLDMGIMKELRNLTTAEGVYASWNHAGPANYDASDPSSFYSGNYWYNFYTYFDKNDIVNQRDRLYGNLAFTYKVNSDLSFTGTYRKQQNTIFSETKIGSDLENSALQTGVKAAYATSTSYSNRQNVEFLGSYKKKINDFDISANIGTDFFSWVSKSNAASTNNGLSIPDLFSLDNTVDEKIVTNGRTQEKYHAVFAKGTLGYKNLLYGNITLRNDWFSTLPVDKNDVLSKSFGASFVFSELLGNYDWLSSGKIRASWGEIPLALGQSNETFGAYRYPGSAYGLGQFKWNGNFLMSTPDQLVDPDIHGAVSTQKEIGLDLSFLKNRFGVSATYWEGTDKNFPYSLSINGASGNTSLLTNIGEISRAGLELQINTVPVSLPKFEWSLVGTWSPLIKNDIVELSKKYEITRTPVIANVAFAALPALVHQEGKRWGQIFGNGIKRIDGKPVLNASGFYVNDPNVYFGSVIPKYTGGVQNSFTLFKDFTVNANIDFQSGGKFVSLSNMWGSYSGLTSRTARVNDKGNSIRDAVADGGGIHVSGVDATGKPVDYYVEAQDYYHNLYNNKTFDEFIYDLSFVKLRELSVGYRIPVKKLNLSKYIQNANLSIVARNPVLIYAKTKDFDPSEIDAVVGETGQLPGTRGFGFNLKIGF